MTVIDHRRRRREMVKEMAAWRDTDRDRNKQGEWEGEGEGRQRLQLVGGGERHRE